MNADTSNRAIRREDTPRHRSVLEQLKLICSRFRSRTTPNFPPRHPERSEGSKEAGLGGRRACSRHELGAACMAPASWPPTPWILRFASAAAKAMADRQDDGSEGFSFSPVRTGYDFIFNALAARFPSPFAYLCLSVVELNCSGSGQRIDATESRPDRAGDPCISAKPQFGEIRAICVQPP